MSVHQYQMVKHENSRCRCDWWLEMRLGYFWKGQSIIGNVASHNLDIEAKQKQDELQFVKE